MTSPSSTDSRPSLAAAVRDRYAAAARVVQPALCCPVDYDARWLEIVPQEVIERDYGCGDPSKWVQPGEVVLDLGCGGGKICFIAAQVVGPRGRVIGVDCTDDMLALARKHQPTIAERTGFDNVTFRKGRIQDLRLDLEQLEHHLASQPVANSTDWLRAHDEADRLRRTSPMIPDSSIDVVVSNCVLNLVHEDERRQLFSEVHRVLRPGGRAVISDIVCDEDVPGHLKDDPQLWSGCLSGAYREAEFLEAFEQAGFYGIEIVSPKRPVGCDPRVPWVRPAAWAIVEGIEFRSLTVRAWKRLAGPRRDRRQAVIYHGPWKSVTDDAGQTLHRGRRMAVCDQTYRFYAAGPYADQITPVPPAVEVAVDAAPPFDVRSGALPLRSPRESKRGQSDLNGLPNDDCCGETGCCEPGSTPR